jgi:hypothetical protein
MYKDEYFWKVDPDSRQDRACGECVTRKMTDEERQKYGKATGIKRVGFGLTSGQVDKALRNRGLKRVGT